MRPRSLSRTVGATAVALAMVSALSCHRTKVELVEPTLGRNLIGSLEIVEENVPPTDLTKVEPEDLARHIEAIYRLKPDRRFLAAVSDIHRLVGGRQETAFVRHVDGGGWLIHLGSEEVGKLPELPSFADGLEFARRWAAREWQLRGRPDAEAADRGEVARLEGRIWHSSYLEHLQILDRANALARKAPHDAGLMKVAADSLLAVDLDTQDWAEMLDPALGRAMALLAMSEASSGAPVSARSLSMLAAALGYWNEAVDLAALLEPGDPWDRYVNGDAAQLMALVKKTNDPFVAVLAMKALATHGTEGDAIEAARAAGLADPPSFAFLSGMVGLQSMSLQPEVDEQLAAEAFRLAVNTTLPSGKIRGPSVLGVLKDLWYRLLKRPIAVSAVPARLREFEAAAERQGAGLGGRLVDRVTMTAILRAPLYTALLAEAHYYLDQFGSSPPAARLAAAIVEPPPGAATELKQWIEDRVAVQEAAPGGMERVARDMGTLRCLGVWAPYRLIWSVGGSLKVWWDPVARRPIRGMFDGMDTRTSHLVAASVLGGNLLWDVRTWQHNAMAAAERDPRALMKPQLVFVLANETDMRLLWSMATRADLDAGTRAAALERIAEVAPGQTVSVVATLRTLVKSGGPGEASVVVKSLVAVLDKAGSGGEADRVIDEWLETRGPSAGLAFEAMLAFKARRLRDLGRLDEAWQVIEPAIASWKGDCLEEAAHVLLKMKRPTDALKVAEMAVERYPDVPSGHALVAQALWELNRPHDAAVRLKSGLQRRSEYAWRGSVAAAFCRAFPGPDPTRAMNAVDDLQRAGVSALSVSNLAQGTADHGDHELAFRMLSALVATSSKKDQTMLSAFEELKKARGLDAAFEWLRGRVPVLTDPIIIVAYSLGADDIVWDYPGHRVGRDKSFIWVLLRAAAYARSPHPSPEQRELILEYCRRQREGTIYSVFPRYLLGEADEHAVLSFAKDKSDICTIAWMIGSRKASEGKVAEAADWFQVAMETGDTSQPPYSMSYMLMAKWAGTKKLMENLATEKVLF
jgi:tetratricopeptide (TPR) repeat protein